MPCFQLCCSGVLLNIGFATAKGVVDCGKLNFLPQSAPLSDGHAAAGCTFLYNALLDRLPRRLPGRSMRPAGVRAGCPGRGNKCLGIDVPPGGRFHFHLRISPLPGAQTISRMLFDSCTAASLQ